MAEENGGSQPSEPSAEDRRGKAGGKRCHNRGLMTMKQYKRVQATGRQRRSRRGSRAA